MAFHRLAADPSVPSQVTDAATAATAAAPALDVPTPAPPEFVEEG